MFCWAFYYMYTVNLLMFLYIYMCVWLWMLSAPCLIPCVCVFYLTHVRQWRHQSIGWLMDSHLEWWGKWWTAQPPAVISSRGCFDDVDTVLSFLSYSGNPSPVWTVCPKMHNFESGVRSPSWCSVNSLSPISHHIPALLDLQWKFSLSPP